MYMTDLQDQDDIDEAMGWLTEHVWGDDFRAILIYHKKDGTTLKATSFDYREKHVFY